MAKRKRTPGPRGKASEGPARPSAADAVRPQDAGSGEVAFHELGETIVASAISIQRELRRYSESNGAFMVEDLEIEMPMKLRMDPLGQVMAELVADVPANMAVARVRLKIRPDPNPGGPAPIIADQPLEVLKTFSQEQLSFLASNRIFSVEDLTRAARNLPGKKALAGSIPEETLGSALKRGSVLQLPFLPGKIGEALLEAGIGSADDFLGRDPLPLAGAVGKIVGEAIPGSRIADLQRDILNLRKPIPRRTDEQEPI